MAQKIYPIQPQGVIGAPPTMYFQKIQFLGVFRPFLQRSLPKSYLIREKYMYVVEDKL